MTRPDLEAELAALTSMNLDALRHLWRRKLRSQPPRVSAGLLRLALAHNLQEKALGGLSKAAERQLRAFAAPRRGNVIGLANGAASHGDADAGNPPGANAGAAAGARSGAASGASSASVARHATTRTPLRSPRPGMRMVRVWNDVAHVVTINDAGEVMWQDRCWRSLSEVARAITGTRWSGPRFFGLRDRNAAVGHSA